MNALAIPSDLSYHKPYFGWNGKKVKKKQRPLCEKAKIAKNLEVLSQKMNALAIPLDLSPHKPSKSEKKNFGFFSIFLDVFGFFWVFKFQLEIQFSDCMGSTRYSFRPFWANKSREKNFSLHKKIFSLHKKNFQKIRSLIKS